MPSAEQVANSPLGAKAIQGADLPCGNECSSFPVAADQIRAVPSAELVPRFLPSREKATQFTFSSWASITVCNSPLAVSQSRAVESLAAEARVLPSGENASVLMGAE